MNKLLVVCGPTATGKTKLALDIASRFNGELISADSRQIYKGMDIGTGKDLPESAVFRSMNKSLDIKKKEFSIGYYYINNIPVWLYDIAEPDQKFNVANYYDIAWKVIKDVWKRNKLPILVGGTGLYIKSVIDGIDTFGISENKALRKDLEEKNVEYLQNKLKSINENKYLSMNDSDKKNPRRLVRAIEISSSKNVAKYKFPLNKIEDKNILMIGLTCDRKKLNQIIDTRVVKRVDQGIIDEIKGLINKGYNWNMQSFSSIGYKEWKGYFNDSWSKDEVILKWTNSEYQYVKRQLTWFNKDKRIVWYDILDKGFKDKVYQKVNIW